MCRGGAIYQLYIHTTDILASSGRVTTTYLCAVKRVVAISTDIVSILPTEIIVDNTADLIWDYECILSQLQTQMCISFTDVYS